MTKIKFVEYLFVGTQFVLFLAFFPDIHIADLDFPKWLSSIGLILVFGGILLAFMAIYQIRNSVSAFPSPLPEAQLMTSGVFKLIRHPIYSGILLAGMGYALHTDSLFRMILTALLFILFYFKSSYEEKLLTQKFPGYKEYQQNSGRFWPKING